MKNKGVLITGAAGLIGQSIARIFAEKKYDLFLLDIELSKVESIARELSSEYSVKVECNGELDLTDQHDVDSYLRRCFNSNTAESVVVASHYPRTTDWSNKVEEVSYQSFCKNLDIHLGTYFHLSQRACVHFASNGGGSVVLMNSIYGLRAPRMEVYSGTSMTMPVAYAAIKGAISNLTKYFAATYAKSNVRINSVCAGGVFDEQQPTFVENYCGIVPAGRMATSGDIANAVAFLAENGSSYINGVNLPVDGGWTAV